MRETGEHDAAAVVKHPTIPSSGFAARETNGIAAAALHIYTPCLQAAPRDTISASMCRTPPSPRRSAASVRGSSPCLTLHLHPNPSVLPASTLDYRSGIPGNGVAPEDSQGGEGISVLIWKPSARKCSPCRSTRGLQLGASAMAAARAVSGTSRSRWLDHLLAICSLP
jgi:hypothetical protein